jgi:hypothetical protein
MFLKSIDPCKTAISSDKPFFDQSSPPHSRIPSIRESPFRARNNEPCHANLVSRYVRDYLARGATGAKRNVIACFPSVVTAPQHTPHAVSWRRHTKRPPTPWRTYMIMHYIRIAIERVTDQSAPGTSIASKSVSKSSKSSAYSWKNPMNIHLTGHGQGNIPQELQKLSHRLRLVLSRVLRTAIEHLPPSAHMHFRFSIGTCLKAI